jgi:hypothetical protein
MITFFTTPKPFRGHIGVIQRNAIESWKRIHPSAEVILFGDEDGAAEAAGDLNIRHVPDVKRNEHGTKYLSPIFDAAQDLARHDRLCYINCDIILLSDFRLAAERVTALGGKFLMAGQRWDTDITAPVDFYAADWQATVRRLAREANHQRPPQWVDYFLFSRGLYYKNTPPFVIGRPGWDPWLVWFARDSGARVVDATQVVVAVHQNHDYLYHPEGEKGVWEGEEAQKNIALLDRWRLFRTLENATHRLTQAGIQRNHRHWWVLAKTRISRMRTRCSFRILNWTRPLRHRIGLHQTPPVPHSPSRTIESLEGKGTKPRVSEGTR